MAGHWPNGSTRAWRKTRALVLERDGHICQLQIPEVCLGTATHVHHIQDRDIVGDDPAPWGLALASLDHLPAALRTWSRWVDAQRLERLADFGFARIERAVHGHQPQPGRRASGS